MTERIKFQLLGGVAVLGLVVLTTIGFYRLWFHPLASFPGPKAAALSTDWLYRASFGKYVEKTLDELHDEYNSSVIRIAPNELHIRKPELYKTIYSQSTTYYKPWSFYQSLSIPHSLTTETDPDMHRDMRRILNPYFSKRSVEQLSSLVIAKIERLDTKLRRMDKTFDAHNAVMCLTVELITEFLFGRQVNMIEASENTFDADFLEIFEAASTGQPELLFHPTMSRIKFALPRPLLLVLDKKLGKLLQIGVWAHGCVDYHNTKNRTGERIGHPVIFDSLGNLSDVRKASMATELLVAGSDTSGTTLTYALYHISSNSKIKERLTEELRKAMPTLDTTPALLKLEQLPYLSACVKESLRLACPVPGRLPRIVPNGKSLIVDGKHIPSGTIVGMSAYNLHFAESLWGSDVHEFNPDRWLGQVDDKLDQWLAPFSKGARSCIGQNLALAEIRMTIAVLFRRFEFSLPPGSKINSKHDSFTVHLASPGLPLQCKPKKE
ncbi:cytochrome P450 [Talaromyces proteolyticus]|uniref:Cytochrome P450 n=1 Tax=Talaromyces proteolyticus TaxID=1131652 RepID=A0AAD4L625_9EURO|nr:cytochrome P450 [Talaromyces proteolyticus]KAH8705781.1 cytochrome P450 [Talaromyces proteolyticus]